MPRPRFIVAVLALIAAMPFAASAEMFSFLDGKDAGNGPVDGSRPARLELQHVSTLELPEELVWGPEPGDVEISPSLSFFGDSYDVGENITFTGQLFMGYNVTPIFQTGVSVLYTTVKARDPVVPAVPPNPATQATTGPTSTLLFMPTVRVHFIFDKEARFDPYIQFALGGGRIFPRGKNSGAFVVGPGGGIRAFVVPKAALDLQFQYLFINSNEDYESVRFLFGGAFLFDL